MTVLLFAIQFVWILCLAVVELYFSLWKRPNMADFCLVACAWGCFVTIICCYLCFFFCLFFFLNSFVAFALVLPNPGLSPLLSFYLAPGGLLYWCVSHSVPVRSGWTTCRRCPLPRKWGSSRDIFHPTKVIQSSRRRTALWLLVVILPECGRDPEV